MDVQQVIQFIKQMPGRFHPGLVSSLNQKATPEQVAYLRRLQKEARFDWGLNIPFSELPVVVFDLETTGFFPDKGDEILSIGAIRVVGNSIADGEMFYSTVRTDKPIPSEIVALTGIHEAEVEQSPPLSKVLADFFSFVKHDTLVAHHANHEKAFMQHAVKRLMHAPFRHRMVDTSFFIRVVDPDLKELRLEACLARCGIEVSNRHHALSDAIMTAKLWCYFVEKMQEMGLRTLRDGYERLAKNG